MIECKIYKIFDDHKILLLNICNSEILRSFSEGELSIEKILIAINNIHIKIEALLIKCLSNSSNIRELQYLLKEEGYLECIYDLKKSDSESKLVLEYHSIL